MTSIIVEKAVNIVTKRRRKVPHLAVKRVLTPIVTSVATEVYYIPGLKTFITSWMVCMPLMPCSCR